MSPSAVIERERATKLDRGRIRPGGVQIDIVLAYHQAVVRTGLRMLLEEVSDFTVVGEAADVAGARECVRDHSPDVLVLDLDQPAGSALEAISQLVEESPATRLVVMSSRRDPAFVRAAIAAGAKGYVPNAATEGELMLTIRRAASTTSTLAEALDVCVSEHLSPSSPCDLSPREVEVLGLIAMGYTNTEIANRLALSVRTVETHRSHIRRKLERPTRAELVEYAFEHGMGQPRA
jgi:two-component system, NarL family, response regulator NreC